MTEPIPLSKLSVQAPVGQLNTGNAIHDSAVVSVVNNNLVFDQAFGQRVVDAFLAQTGLVDGQARAEAFERWRGVLASKAAAESARRRKDVEERFLAEPFEGSVSLEDLASPEFQAELAWTLEAAALTPSKKAHELLAKLLARRLRKGPDLAEATKLQVATARGGQQ